MYQTRRKAQSDGPLLFIKDFVLNSYPSLPFGNTIVKRPTLTGCVAMSTGVHVHLASICRLSSSFNRWRVVTGKHYDGSTWYWNCCHWSTTYTNGHDESIWHLNFCDGWTWHWNCHHESALYANYCDKSTWHLNYRYRLIWHPNYHHKSIPYATCCHRLTWYPNYRHRSIPYPTCHHRLTWHPNYHHGLTPYMSCHDGSIWYANCCH